jgi:hypothetical protein
VPNNITGVPEDSAVVIPHLTWFDGICQGSRDFFARHAYFLGQNGPYGAVKTTLKAEIDVLIVECRGCSGLSDRFGWVP